MRTQIDEVLVLQTDWTSLNTVEMSLRGDLIRRVIPNEVRAIAAELFQQLSDAVGDLKVEGSDGTGLKNEVPWVRVFSPSRSKRATSGWYLVYLFDAFGDRAYLSINQGTTRWNGADFRPRSKEELIARAEWAREALASKITRDDLQSVISLPTRSSPLGAGYASGNVVAIEYEVGGVSLDPSLSVDLRYMTALLADLYLAEDAAAFVPGDPAPEVLDAQETAAVAAGRRVPNARLRISGPERRAIEARAVHVAIEYLQGLGYKTKDVGARESYDIDATKGQERLYVEVKGTVSPGDAVVLTRNEVLLHREVSPNNMLIVVSGILLERGVEPSASGGSLLAISPWSLDEERLVPLSYSYSGAELLSSQQAPQMPRPAS